MYQRLFILLVFVLVLTPATLAQETDCNPTTTCPIALDDLSYASAIEVFDLSSEIGRDKALAPDGSAIAWYDRSMDLTNGAICLFILADETISCDLIPEPHRHNPAMLQWSPDSAYIAFTGNYITSFRDTDIFVYDVAQHQITNRTNDGHDDWRPGQPTDNEGAGPVWIDANLTWGTDGNLYFIRTTFPTATSVEEEALTGLYRMAPLDGEPELIQDWTGIFPTFPAFMTSGYSLDGILSLSPDLQQAALPIFDYSPDSTVQGIWVIDLSGEAPPRQVIAFESLSLDTAEDNPNQAVIMPTALTWDAEGTGLYLLAETYGLDVDLFGLAYYVDVTTGQITLLTDVLHLNQEELLAIDPETNHSRRFSLAWSAVLSGASTGLLIFNYDLSGPAGISALQLVDNAGKQDLLYALENVRVVPGEPASVAVNGTVLMGSYLFIPND